MEVQPLNKWKYGFFWEEYPIKEKEIWDIGKNRLYVADVIRDKEAILNEFLKGSFIDMSYIDPPWNNSNLNSYYTKAGMREIRSKLKILLECILDILKQRNVPVNYIEMGNQQIDMLKFIIEAKGGIITNDWHTTYYGKYPSRLIRFVFEKGSRADCYINFNSYDDEKLPRMAITYEGSQGVLDLCAGRGLTGRSAHISGASFYGVELNKRRLAVLIDYYIKAGLKIRVKEN